MSFDHFYTVVAYLLSVLRYAEAHFRQGMQKVLNDVGKVFGVRIIAVGVRPGPGGQFLVSV